MIFGRADIDAAAEFAVPHAVEEINHTAQSPSQTTKRIQVITGRLNIRARHMNTPRIGKIGTNGHAKRTRSFRRRRGAAR